MMRWLKRCFKKTEEKKQNVTEECFRMALQKVVPLGNSYVDIFNEIELIKFNKIDERPYSRPLEVKVKWRRSMEVSTFTINYHSYGDSDDEHFMDEFCSYLESRYNDYREKLVKNFTDKIGDVTADG